MYLLIFAHYVEEFFHTCTPCKQPVAAFLEFKFEKPWIHHGLLGLFLLVACLKYQASTARPVVSPTVSILTWMFESNWVVATQIFLLTVHPEKSGRWTHFDEHIFQRGWFNHQLVKIVVCGCAVWWHLMAHPTAHAHLHLPPLFVFCFPLPELSGRKTDWQSFGKECCNLM